MMNTAYFNYNLRSETDDETNGEIEEDGDFNTTLGDILTVALDWDSFYGLAVCMTI